MIFDRQYETQGSELYVTGCVFSFNQAPEGPAMASFEHTTEDPRLTMSSVAFVENTLLCGSDRYLSEFQIVSETLRRDGNFAQFVRLTLSPSLRESSRQSSVTDTRCTDTPPYVKASGCGPILPASPEAVLVFNQ